MKAGIFLLSVILNLITVKSEMYAENVLLAINCGGDAFKDSKDIEYMEDSYVEGGQSSDFGSQFDIKNTNDQTVYQTERWSQSDIVYKLPIPEGKYVLVLKFSEVYFNNMNEKVFDVYIGDKKVIQNIDIFAKVGKSTAYDEFLEFEVKGDKIYVGGKLIEGGYNAEEETMKLIFRKGQSDNPKINAIVVVKGNLGDTDYEAFKNSLDELEKAKEEKERKQREIKKRNSLHYDFEEFEEDFVDTEIEQKTSKLTLLIIYSIIGFGTYLVFFRKGNQNIEIEDEK